MSEEIVIKTEIVKVSELQGREKQIYEYAYSKGYHEGEKEGGGHKSRVLILAVFGAGSFIYFLIKLFLNVI